MSIKNFSEIEQMMMSCYTNKQGNSDYSAFMSKLEKFNKKMSVKEAKKLAKELFAIKDEVNYLKVGKDRCIILSQANLLRICFDSDNKYICYNFTNRN